MEAELDAGGKRNEGNIEMEENEVEEMCKYGILISSNQIQFVRGSEKLSDGLLPAICLRSEFFFPTLNFCRGFKSSRSPRLDALEFHV